MTRNALVLTVLGVVTVSAGAVAVVLNRKRELPKQPKEMPMYLNAPVYPIKYTAQALQLAALPSLQGPVMLCSYIPFASLESSDIGGGWNALYRLRGEYEAAPESMYGHTGRRQIVRLLKRYFDPKTYAELPSDILYESDQKFRVPTSPDPGVPCG